MPTYGLYLSTLVHEFIGIYVRKLSNLTINQQKKPKFDIEKIDSKIKILDSELRKTKKIIELEYTTKNNDFNF